MHGLHQLEIIVVLLAAVLALTTVAQKLVIPYPILLVIGGLVLALVPGLPAIRLDPDLVFLVFLPPILWAAAYFTSLREFRANIRPISFLAVGLVLATTAAVAAVARLMLPGMGWAEAIALGAIVSPPDAVSATAIAKRLGIPRRIVTILEGESLVNDATALVLYRTAVTAAVTGTFVLNETVLQFVLAAGLGVLIGLAVGAATQWLLTLTADSFTEIAVTLLAPYVAWVLAEHAHASAVLACVTGGLYLRQHFSGIVSPLTRIQGRAVWDLVVFVLNGVIFILIGLQLSTLREAVPADRFGSLLITGVAVSGTAILVRLMWVPLEAWLPRVLSPSLRERDPPPPWSHVFLTAWTGMRGIVTLAAALALPERIGNGAPFPYRAEIILLSFSVILATLVLQGLSLAPLVRALKLEEDRSFEHEEMAAREQAASSALARLDQLKDEEWPIPEQVERLRVHYGQRQQRYANSAPVDPDCTAEAADSFRRLRQETLTAERRAAIDLRNEGHISDEVLHRIEHELDVEALRLGLAEHKSAVPQKS
ncbi:MAG TPA: Na+/H+ antiporter [Nitrospiraceae bacterium]|nr:Na+/H+ antiporter [Nitrospiraceae bacterium]